MADKVDSKLELLRNKLEKLLEVTENLVDSEIVSLSQELDKLILLEQIADLTEFRTESVGMCSKGYRQQNVDLQR